MPAINHSHTKVQLCFFEPVPNMTNYIFSPHLQLSDGKQLFLQHETTSYVSDFPLRCSDHSTLLCNCDHSNLMERDPYCPAAGNISATQISHTVLLFWDFQFFLESEFDALLLATRKLVVCVCVCGHYEADDHDDSPRRRLRREHLSRGSKWCRSRR